MSTPTSTQSRPQKHPLQRLESPSAQDFSSILHVCTPSSANCWLFLNCTQLLGLSSYVYSFKWLHDNPTPINDSYGWHFQYLTIIGLSLATLTFLAGLLADFTSSQRLFHAKNILSMCATPLEVLISVLYWTLRTYDKSLVIPDWAQLPLQADVSFHAIPSIVLTLDLLLLSPPWEISASRAMGLSTVLAFSYWFWVEQCFAHNGFYPYPIFDMVGFAGRIGLFTTSAAIMTGSTMVLERIYAMVNGTTQENKGKGMDEGSIKEQMEAYAKEVNYIAKAQVGTGETGR